MTTPAPSVPAPADCFARSSLVLGEAGMRKLAESKAIVFGVGGVGSWCAEALIRTGLGKITLVDCDIVAASNINRQAMADTHTVGEIKVEAMKRRLLAINPDAGIETVHARFDADSADRFALGGYDVAVDAIDSVDAKAELIRRAVATENLGFFSSMGAALRTDPSLVRTGPFSKVAGDGLAKALRRRFRERPPLSDFVCVHSVEPPVITGREGRGSLMTVTAAFGLALAAAAIKFLLAKAPQK